MAAESARSVLPAILLAVALPFFETGTARAQSMDYGALESLFGEPVTTSVTGSPQRASEVPASMTIITADEIRRSGARDLPGILRHVAGIDVLQWTNDQADVSVRGYNQVWSPRVLVLVDGRQVYTDYYGYTPWPAIPVELSDIRQIEVVRGPNGALFGFNAVAGVINIITYKPLYDEVNTASITGGTQDRVEGSATATYRIDGLGGIRVSLGGRDNDDFSTPQPPVFAGTRLGDRRLAGDILGQVRLGPDAEASLELSHSEAREAETIALYTGGYNKYRTSSADLRLSADTALGTVSAKAYGNWFNAALAIPPPVGTIFPVDMVAYVAQLQDVFKLGSAHTVRLSFEYRFNSMSTTPLGGAHVFYDVLSGGAMWNWKIDGAWSLTNAVRLDSLSLGREGLIPPGLVIGNWEWNRRTLDAFSFNSGLVWQANPDNTLRLSVARASQLPNLVEFGGALVPSPFGYVTGIPGIGATTVTNYEFGWHGRFPGMRMTANARIFHQENRDLISNYGGSVPARNLAIIPVDIGSSDATGIELTAKGAFGEGWRWSLSYTPEWICDSFAPGLTVANTLIDYEHTRPVHVVDGHLGWSGGPWEIDGYARYESEFWGIRNASSLGIFGSLAPVPDYVSVDARIAYRIGGNVTLAVSGQNLLDSPQRQTAAAPVERRVFVTATADF